MAELEAVIGADRTTTSRPRSAKSEEPSNFLAMYFKDMARLAVLRPQEEFESARKLEALEIALWARMLVVRAGDRARAQGLRAHARELDRRVQDAAQAPRRRCRKKPTRRRSRTSFERGVVKTCGEAARARHRQAHPRHRARRAQEDRPRRCRAASSTTCSTSRPSRKAFKTYLQRGRVVVQPRARRQERVRQGEPAPGGLDRAALQLRAHAARRPDPGGQHRPHQGGRALRLPSRLPLLDVRVVVDPARHLARARRQGARGAAAGAHD